MDVEWLWEVIYASNSIVFRVCDEKTRAQDGETDWTVESCESIRVFVIAGRSGNAGKRGNLVRCGIDAPNAMISSICDANRAVLQHGDSPQISERFVGKNS